MEDDGLEYWEMPKSSRRWAAAFAEGRQQAIKEKSRQENKKDYQRKKARKNYQKIADRYGERCACCGSTERLVVDHIVAIANGGTSDLDNLQILCWTCNSQKGSKTIDYRG